LTEAGKNPQPSSLMQLLIGDGIVKAFRSSGSSSSQAKKPRAAAQARTAGLNAVKGAESAPSLRLSTEGEALAARLREWRAAEAKRLKVPAFLVLHDRALAALAQARPTNPRELLRIDGIGPAKVERFGDDLLRICEGK
jgi:superfamily II DNA helicase RecQ